MVYESTAVPLQQHQVAKTARVYRTRVWVLLRSTRKALLCCTTDGLLAVVVVAMDGASGWRRLRQGMAVPGASWLMERVCLFPS